MLDLLPERIARYRVADLAVVYCNAAKAADYGLTPDEMTGRPLEDVLTPDRFPRVREHLRRLGPDRPTVRAVFDLRRPDQPDRWIEWVDRWLPGEDGGEILSVGRDVTEAHEAELALAASEERFRRAMADAPIGMAIVGLDHRFRQVNRALRELLGRDEDELLAMTTLEVTHPDDVEADLAYGHGDGRRGDAGLVKRYVRPDGSVVWGLLKVSTLTDADGTPRELIGQVVDVTERVEREERLLEVASREHGIAERLRHVDQVKNTFLTAASHELRTSLTVVRGLAATLRRLGGAVDGATRATLESAIERHAERLQRLLDELLDVDRLARGAVTARREQVDVAALVRRVVAEADVRGRAEVIGPATLPAYVDPVQLERIVANLLDNAGKYAPEGPVTVSLAPFDGDGVVLEVRDRGDGIADADRHRIFAPFHRGHDDHPRPGTGIGLALVAAFARLHEGHARSEPADDGAHLVVTLPGPRGADGASDQAAGPSPS
jgi:PAS domain S-box-containing protein